MNNNCKKCQEHDKLHKCDEGCKYITTTDCVIHRSNDSDCLDLPKETNLANIIKTIDEKLCSIVFNDIFVKVSETDTDAGYLIDKISTSGNVKPTKLLGESIRFDVELFNKSLVDWGQCEFCNNIIKTCPDGFVYNALTDKCKNIECDCDSDTVLPQEALFEAKTIEEAINKLVEITCCLKTDIENIEPPDIDLSTINWELCDPCKDDEVFIPPVTLPEAFDEVLTRICCVRDLISPPQDNLKVFYVDGNNINVGDGSILNPFQTIDSAVIAVIGTGSRNAPQNTNVRIEVATFVYTPAINLFVNTLTVNFSPGTIINHSSGINLIESIDSPSVYQNFAVTGNLFYKRMNPSTRFVNIENAKSVSIDLDYIEDFIGNTSLGTSIVRVNSSNTISGLVAGFALNFNKIVRSYSDTIFDIVGNVNFKVFGKTSTSIIILGASGDTGAINNTTINGRILSYVNTNSNPPPNVDVSVENVNLSTVSSVVNPFYIEGNLRLNGLSQLKNIIISGYGSSPQFPNYFRLNLANDQDTFIIENVKILNTFSTLNPGLVISSTSLRKITLLNNNFPAGFNVDFVNLNFETTINLARKVSINIIDGKLIFTGIEDFVSQPTLAQGYRKNMIWMTKDGTLKSVL